MLSLQIGPLALPTGLVLLIVSLCVAYGVAWSLRRYRQQPDAGPLVSDMLIAGLLAARLAFVLRWHEQYLVAPWSIINIRDGGFLAPAGIAAALAIAAWRCRRPAMAAMRRPLAVSVATGALAWGVLSAGISLAYDKPSALPAVALQALDGAPVTLAALAGGKPMVVNLWASWCPPCRREMPVLAVAQQARDDIVFVYANQREDAAAASAFLERSGVTLRNVLLDSEAALGKAAGSSALPTTLFYDAQGRLIDTHLGELSDASLASKLQKIAPAP
ncbi:TlpA disulfide reductase family protein [Janthinobacterium sp. NKUCC06_STL]|uniref:TlpA disulfide reductase family protein n=1 Tax=Janthinobacterium sp. NKUCC06_STL TaxID=2842127 RepID=UPI001C5BFAAB|nr:TlpA disulfide reductase family protein [Janthinobacterium sp. NKUCC06_STL]MBW3511509.1 TlpA family protein disulfide reductase [Janthinobacterium sp. NKUCC06_STL]